MKKIATLALFAIATPLVSLASPLELCGINNTCSYKIDGNTDRTIETNITAPGTYTCTSTTTKKPYKLSIKNITSPAGITVTSTENLQANPFLTINATTTGSISYHINNDYWLPLNVTYSCNKIQ